jgi:hypothetical protein
MGNTFSFKANLVVKGDDALQAESFVIKKLNEWFLEDLGKDVMGVGFPNGSLLFWNIDDTAKHRLKSEILKGEEGSARDCTGDIRTGTK